MGTYHRGAQLVARGVSYHAFVKLSSLRRLKRARSDVPNEQLDRLRDELDQQLKEVHAAYASAG